MGEKWTRLISLREERQLSQIEVARALGMSRSGFSMYEIGQREPDLDMVRKLADYFNVSTDYLLGRAIDPKGSSSEPIPSEWMRLINECQRHGLTPDQVIRALSGLTIIGDALAKKERDREG